MSWALRIGEVALSALESLAAVLMPADVPNDMHAGCTQHCLVPQVQEHGTALRLVSVTGGLTGQYKFLCRDIKLENTLLDDAQPQPNVKICDFGYSKNEFVDSRPKTVSGTPDYIAPEVLMADQYDGKKADIWSCGVMLYVMVTGEITLVLSLHGEVCSGTAGAAGM